MANASGGGNLNGRAVDQPVVETPGSAPGRGTDDAAGELPENASSRTGNRRAGRGGAARDAVPDDQIGPSPEEVFRRLTTSGGASVPADDRIAKEYPTLWHFITIRQGLSADGRNGTSFTINCEGTAYSVMVYVRSVGKQAAITLYTLQGLLGALESALRDPMTVWRDIKDWRAKKDIAKKEEKAGG